MAREYGSSPVEHPAHQIRSRFLLSEQRGQDILFYEFIHLIIPEEFRDIDGKRITQVLQFGGGCLQVPGDNLRNVSFPDERIRERSRRLM